MTVQRALLMLGALALLIGFVIPVSAEGHGSCGMAGTWFPYLGDPSGPGEPPEVYAEHNACGRASALPHLGMTAGLLLLLAGSVAALVRNLRND